jgi:hypothetical protein
MFHHEEHEGWITESTMNLKRTISSFVLFVSFVVINILFVP